MPFDIKFSRPERSPADEAARADFRADTIKARLIEQIHHNLIVPIVGNSLLAILVVILFRNEVSTAILGWWLAVTLAWNAIRYILYRRLPAGQEPDVKLAWIRSYTLGVAFAGVLWGAGSILMFTPDMPEFQVFLAFVLGGLAAGAVTSYGPWLPTYFAFALPALLPLIIRLFLEANELAVFMGLMLLIFLGLVSTLARSLHKSLANATGLQVDRGRLETERDVSEAFFAKAFHSSPAVMSVSNLDNGAYLDVNSSWSALTGFSRDEAMQRSDLELGLWLDPADREKFVGLTEKQGSVNNFETVFRNREGKLIDLLLGGEFIDVEGRKRLLLIGQDITRLKEIERIKSEFVSIVSHELRTPLTAVQGALGLVSGGQTGDMPLPAREMIELANRNADRLNSLVNDILDFEKLQSGLMPFNMAPVDLEQITQDVIRHMAPFACEYQVELVFGGGASPVVVTGDDVRIHQVITNILSNAIKFSPADAEVEIAVFGHGKWGRITVSDRGPGIDPADEDKVFERFAQIDSSDTRAKDGTGLGLSITKSIVDRHGGVVGFEPRSGGGTVFYVDLPLAAD